MGYSNYTIKNISMKFRLDHIGIVVEKIDALSKLFRTAGFPEETKPISFLPLKVTGSFINVGDNSNDVYLELLEPTDADSPIANFVQKKGGGLHHLCFEVDDIEKTSRELVQKGFPMVTQPMECPAYDENLKRTCHKATKISFFRISDRILIELIEKGT